MADYPRMIAISIPQEYREASPSLMERLDALAKKEERSRSWIVLQAILRYLEEKERSQNA